MSPHEEIAGSPAVRGPEIPHSPTCGHTLLLVHLWAELLSWDEGSCLPR